MGKVAAHAHAIAVDLPGIGASVGCTPSHDKRTLARYIRSLLDALNMRATTLVGHDIGGQIVYVYLREYPDEFARAVLMNIVIPGIEPWSGVIRNPHIWHFAFHSIPNLSEKLVAARQDAYFKYFYDVLATTPETVSEETQRLYVSAYSRPEALRTGFDGYRAFPQDEKDNGTTYGQPVRTLLLDIRGAKEQGEIGQYTAGLRAAGLQNVRDKTVPGSGRFAPDEQPPRSQK